MKIKSTKCFYTKQFTKKDKQDLQLITRNPGHHKQCGFLQAQPTVSFTFYRVSTCLSLHSLAVCDWADMLTVFIVIKFSCPKLLQINKVPQPYLKQSGRVTKEK